MVSVIEQVTLLLRARVALLEVVSGEELRAERGIAQAATQVSYEVATWDCASGLCNLVGEVVSDMRDPRDVLDYVRDNTRRCVYILRDVDAWRDPVVLRKLRTLAKVLPQSERENARAIVLLTTTSGQWRAIPEVVSVEWPLPTREEIATTLATILGSQPEGKVAPLANGERDRTVSAAIGLPMRDVERVYKTSIVAKRAIDVGLVTREKKAVIAGIPGLTWYEPNPRGLDAIGGNALLKAWCLARRAAFSKAARDYGLPAPKGILLFGPPGTGKSLTAKAVATAFEVALLRLDMGAAQSKYVGESQQQIRQDLAVAARMAPIVLWIDEGEKALAGSTGQQGDGGVSADALGTLLSWMQEQQGVFVVMTANDVTAMPPELLRKGRFDEMFFVDLPTKTERAQVIRAAMLEYKRDPDSIDADIVARATRGFTGAEIAALVPDALFAAFADNARALETSDLVVAAAAVVPLSRTAAEKLDALRAWAKGRARPASAPESEDVSLPTGGGLDL